jgi:MOSC domain-containing protein YiiM
MHNGRDHADGTTVTLHRTTVSGIGARLISIQVGQPRQLGVDGSPDPFETPWTTGIFKLPVADAVYVGASGIEGDGQADLSVHGGPDKAVCVYCGDHYQDWTRSPGLSAMGPGAFGENFTLEGVSESAVCIGDIWTAGEVRLQVSQPRQPCWKLARKWRIRDFADRVIKADRTGWYFRVLQAGWLAAGARLALQERTTPEWSVSAANRVMHGRPFDRAASAALARVPTLSASWRATLSKR